MQFTPGLTAIDSLQVPSGWGNTIQLDNGLEIRGLAVPLSVIHNATFNILGAPLVFGIIGSPGVVELYDVTTQTIAAPVQPVKIDFKMEVPGKVDGNVVRATGPVEVTPKGSITIKGNADGSAAYHAELGLSVDSDATTAGRVNVSGATAVKGGLLDVYQLLLNGGDLWVQDFGTVWATGQLPTNNPNFPAASIVAQSSTARGAQVVLGGRSPSLTTEWGLHFAQQIGNILAMNPQFNTVLTLNGVVYTGGRVSIFDGAGSISSDSNITLYNARFDTEFSGAANSPVLWTCKTFTGAGGPAGTGATVNAKITNLPANSITYTLVKTTNGMGSTTGKITNGQINGAAYPPGWEALIKPMSLDEVQLKYIQPA